MQIGQRYQEPSMAALEERVQVPEDRVTALADVVRVLADGLEELPAAEPGRRRAAEAARRTCDLLLAAGPRMSGPQAGADDRDA